MATVIVKAWIECDRDFEVEFDEEDFRSTPPDEWDEMIADAVRHEVDNGRVRWGWEDPDVDIEEETTEGVETPGL